jgi:hypothetical protein
VGTVLEQTGSAKNTQKLLLEVPGKLKIECVVIPQVYVCVCVCVCVCLCVRVCGAPTGRPIYLLCYTVVTLLLHCCYTVVVTLLLNCCHTLK